VSKIRKPTQVNFVDNSGDRDHACLVHMEHCCLRLGKHEHPVTHAQTGNRGIGLV